MLIIFFRLICFPNPWSHDLPLCSDNKTRLFFSKNNAAKEAKLNYIGFGFRKYAFD